MNWLAHTVCLKERSNDLPELEDPSSFSGLAHERQGDFGVCLVIGDRYLSHFRKGSETFKTLVVMEAATYMYEFSPLLCSSNVHPSEKART